MYSFKDFKYTDYKGTERIRTFDFDLNPAEVINLESSVGGGWAERMERIRKAKEHTVLLKEFKDLCFLSYGVMSDDGEIFDKSEEIRHNFECSAAYPEIYLILATNSKIATDFCRGIFPANLNDRIKTASEYKFE